MSAALPIGEEGLDEGNDSSGISMLPAFSREDLGPFESKDEEGTVPRPCICCVGDARGAPEERREPVQIIQQTENWSERQPGLPARRDFPFRTWCFLAMAAALALAVVYIIISGGW